MISRFTHNWTLKLTSLVLAIVLWSHVRGEVNPLETGTFRVRLKANVPREVIVAGAERVPDWVQVTLRAPRQTLRDLKAEPPNPLAPPDASGVNALRASLDWSGLALSKLAPGKQNVPVKAVSPGPDAEVLGVKPADVSLSLDRAARRTLPVSVVLRPDPAPFFGVESVTAAVPQAEVLGPNAAVARVHHLEARADIGTPSGGVLLVGSAPLIARDARGRVVGGVRVEPQSSRVEAVLRENRLSRRARVRVEVRGQSAPGFRVAGVEVSPSSLRLSGPRRLLSQIKEVRAAVDIAGASQDVQRRVRLDVPRGVAISRETIVVRVRIERVPEKASDVPRAEPPSAVPDAERDLPSATPEAAAPKPGAELPAPAGR